MITEVDEVQYSPPKYSIVTSSEIKEPVTSDKERLKFVVVNLLSNTVKIHLKLTKWL